MCGADMVALEGSKQFVDVLGLAGNKVSQRRIVTVQALIATHKGISSLHSINWRY
jgi:hypothetical protein